MMGKEKNRSLFCSIDNWASEKRRLAEENLEKNTGVLQHMKSYMKNRINQIRLRNFT